MKSLNSTKISYSVWFLASLMLSGLLGGADTSLAAEDTWTYKAEMPTGRGFVTGTVVDGKIYVIDGFPTHSSVSSAVEIYDPTADSWTTIANGTMSVLSGTALTGLSMLTAWKSPEIRPLRIHFHQQPETYTSAPVKISKQELSSPDLSTMPAFIKCGFNGR